MLKSSIAACRKRIFAENVSESGGDNTDLQNLGMDGEDVIEWFSQTGNTDWLVIMDNVDEQSGQTPLLAELIQNNISTSDHGSVLVTTRMASLGQQGEALHLNKLDSRQSQDMLVSWLEDSYGRSRSIESYNVIPDSHLQIKPTCHIYCSVWMAFH